MNTVNVKIDISRPAGRKLLRELETKRVAKIEYPLPANFKVSSRTTDEIFEEGVAYLNAHYGTNFKL